MRGKFGENPASPARLDDSSMHIRSGPSLKSSSGIGSNSQYWDEYGEHCSDFNKIPSAGEITSPASSNKVKNWRQLFDQEELDMAY